MMVSERGSYVERNRNVSDYVAKKKAAIERAERLREERRRAQEGDLDALDAHTSATPVKSGRQMDQRHYQKPAYSIAENAHRDALDALGGLVKTPPASPSPTAVYRDYAREAGMGQEDALDNLMRRDGTPSKEGQGRDTAAAYEGRGFGRRQASRESAPRRDSSRHSECQQGYGQGESSGTERRPLSRQDSLTLLKKRNPNATRRRSTCGQNTLKRESSYDEEKAARACR